MCAHECQYFIALKPELRGIWPRGNQLAAYALMHKPISLLAHFTYPLFLNEDIQEQSGYALKQLKHSRCLFCLSAL